jgi:hypothetical protein
MESIGTEISEKSAYTKIPDFLQNYFTELDKDKQPLSEKSIASGLQKIAKDHEPLSNEALFALQCEISAFNFTLLQGNAVSPWGTEFGPMFTGTLEDGTESCFPDARELSNHILDYWKQRVETVSHPVLQARYSDLLWDLTGLVTREKPDFKYATTAIDCYIDVVERKLSHHMLFSIRYSERALTLAIRISDKCRIERAKQNMFALYDDISNPSQGGSWPFLFDNFYGNKKAALTEEELRTIIESLEGLLSRYSNFKNNEEFNPHHAKEAGERLSKYYRDQKQPDEVKRVTRAWCGAFESISRQAVGMLAVDWLLEVQEAYEAAGLHDDVVRVQLATEEKSKSVQSEMKKITVPLELTLEEVEQFCSELALGSADDSLKRIALAFIPSSERARSTIEQIKKDSVLYSLIPIQIYSNGQPVGKVGSVDDDLEGRLLIQIRQAMDFQSVFLEGSIDKLREKSDFNLESVVEFIFKSPIFTANAQTLVREGISAWIDGDYVKAIHILVPQIESALRQILAVMHIPTTKLMRGGAVDIKNLGDVLREEAIETALGECIVRYFKALFSDRRGVNLRNLLAHGMWSAKALNRGISDRVVHSVLVLGLVRVDLVENS